MTHNSRSRKVHYETEDQTFQLLDSPNQLEGPELPDGLFVADIRARGLVLIWKKDKFTQTLESGGSQLLLRNASCEIQKMKERWVSFKITSSDIDKGIYETVYVGKERTFHVENLIPSTNYEFHLRVRWGDAPDMPWSDQYCSVTCKTTDESEKVRVFETLIKGVKANDRETVYQALAYSDKLLNLTSTDKDGSSLTMLACRYASGDILRSLIEKGAPLYSTNISGKTPVSYAVSYRNYEALKVLIKYGADLNFPDKGGSTPIMWAVLNGHYREGELIMNALIEAGAAVNAVDYTGYTAIDRLLCLPNCNISFFLMLVGAGAKILKYCQKPHFQTSLMMAAMSGNVEAVRLLLDMACDPNITTPDSKHTALDFARTNEHWTTVKLLEQFLIKK